MLGVVFPKHHAAASIDKAQQCRKEVAGHPEDQQPGFRIQNQPRKADLKNTSSNDNSPRETTAMSTHQPREENHHQVTKRGNRLMHGQVFQVLESETAGMAGSMVGRFASSFHENTIRRVSSFLP